MNRLYKSLIVLTNILVLVSSGVVKAEIDLRVSHQWPSDQNDIRHEMVKIMANEINHAKSGVKIKIHPNARLFKPRDQWSAMASDALDISVFPLAYAGTKHPEFNLTLMPAIIKSHEHARRFNKSEPMNKIRKIIEGDDIVVLADTWLAGGIASKGNCIAKPDDVKGLWLRSAGVTFDQMLKGAGAKISSMPSSKIYKALKENELDAAITSSSSLVSFKIYEQSKCLTSPLKNALWFMYEPILMSRASFDRLSSDQQQNLLAAAQKAEDFAFQKAKEEDEKLVKVFKKQGVKVVTMSSKEFAKWRRIAEKTSYRVFRKEVPDGKELLKQAISVK